MKSKATTRAPRRKTYRHGRQGMSRRSAPGTAPGVLVRHPDAHATTIRVLSFGPGEIVDRQVAAPGEAAELVGKLPVTWIDVIGLGDVDTIRTFGERFGLHSLAVEDVVNVHQRPKAEDYPDQLFVVARMPDQGGPIDTEQVSFFLGSGYLLTFQERPGDSFERVRERIRAPQSRIRNEGSDYLLYALLDAVIDSYFPALEHYGERLAELELVLLENPEPGHIAEIHRFKRELLILRRAVWPKRDLLSALVRDRSQWISERTVPYLRDCYDHTIQLMDIMETYRETASALADMYLSSVSARMNEVMKVLTVIATIFIPLTFISGIYGMNFDTDASPYNMPELLWRYGYLFALGVMALVAGGMLYYFWRLGWIWESRSKRRFGAHDAD